MTAVSPSTTLVTVGVTTADGGTAPSEKSKIVRFNYMYQSELIIVSAIWIWSSVYANDVEYIRIYNFAFRLGLKLCVTCEL